MTGLAADADLGPTRGKTVVRRVVVLLHAGGMALGAHEIPILIELGPMQDVVVADLLAGIEVEPALPAFVLWPRVPGDRQRLDAAVGKFDQVLLQRIDAERVFDVENGELAVRAVGLDAKLSVLAEEARRHAEIREGRIVEVAAHRRVSGVIHRVPVLRRAPEPGLGLMASGAGLAADETRRYCSATGRLCQGRLAGG